MKVMHLVTFNIGGAAIAAKRISDALNEVDGIESEVLVLEKKYNDFCMPFFQERFGLILSKIKRKVCDYFFEPKTTEFSQYSSGLFGVSVVNNSAVRNADIIHLHWVNRGFLSINELERLSSLKKPIVWTMHDMWPFTGGCHYSMDCMKYEGRCLGCACIANKVKTAENIQLKKAQVLSKSSFTFVGCSRWMAKCAKESTILKNKVEITTIPNPIGSQFGIKFDTKEKGAIKRKYGISTTKKVLLFGAMEANDLRKGGEILKAVLNMIYINEYEFVIFGKNDRDIAFEGKVPVFMGSCKTEKMVELYNIADVFLAPSIQENLANTVMESLACGTPVVAFNIGGMPDMIDHMINGYLAKPFEVEDYIKGINECIKLKSKSTEISNDVLTKFSNSKIARQYYSVYSQAVEENLR